MNAVRGTEVSDAVAGKTGVRHTDGRETRPGDVARLGVEPGNPGNLTVHVAIRHVGIVGIVFVPTLVGHFDVTVIGKFLFDGAFEMVGLVRERRTAGALVRIRIAAHAVRPTVAEQFDRRRVVQVGARFAIGGAAQTADALALLEVHRPGNKIDGHACAVRREDAGGAALERLDTVDGDVVLEVLISAAGTVQDGHAVLDQGDEGLAAARKAAHGLVVGDRSRGAFDEDTRDELQDVDRIARRLLFDFGRGHGSDVDRGIEQGSLGRGIRHYNGHAIRVLAGRARR